MIKRKRTIVLVFVGAIVLAAVCRFVDYGMYHPCVAVFSSPDTSRFAYLVSDGVFMSTLTLLVSPSGCSGELRRVGYVQSDDALNFHALVWSRDGTLVAASCCLIGSNRLPTGINDQLVYTHGYDFSASSRLVSRNDDGDEPDSWIIRHRQIEQLLLERGGGVVVVRDHSRVYGNQDDQSLGLSKHMRNMTWLEWRKYRKVLRDSVRH